MQTQRDGKTLKLNFMCLVLFSLKLYKDDNEFYSYIPRQDKKKRFFTVPGVDIEKSVSIIFS